MEICSLCLGEFDEDECGMVGSLGMSPIALCPVCNAGVVDYVFQTYGMDDEDKMGPDVMIIPIEMLEESDCPMAFNQRQNRKLN